MLGSGSCTLNLTHHLLQAEGQGEEERHQPGEEGDRGEKGEKREKIRTRIQTSCSLPHVASYELLYLYENIALPIWLSFYKHHISTYMFVVTPRNGPTPSEEDKIHYFW